MRSISLLERWLRELAHPALERDIEFLRALHGIRSLSSHLRSREHEERLLELGVKEDRIATMQGYFLSAARMLESLRSFVAATDAAGSTGEP